MSITGPVGRPPCKVGVAVTDVLTGLYAAVAVLACLHARQTVGPRLRHRPGPARLRRGRPGQRLAQAYLTSGQMPSRQGNAHLQIVPYQAFRHRRRLAGAGGRQRRPMAALLPGGRAPDLAATIRFDKNVDRVANRAILVPLIETVMRRFGSAEWQRRLVAAEVPHAPVLDYAQLFAEPQTAARGLRVTVRDPNGQAVELIGSPYHIAGAALPAATMPPALGQDTKRCCEPYWGTTTRGSPS